MMRAAIYARFSSENQSASSIADQIEVCSRYITKSGWTSVNTYSDAAMSGASRFRPGYQQLLADLDCRLFDVVVVEALDRLGRKLADIADLYDRCTFAGITVVAVNVGEITAMHIGMLGTMAQLYLSDLKQKTWRGQLGRALQGKVPGGKAYGYDLVTTTTGERQINPVEAAIVSRIFTELRTGKARARSPSGSMLKAFPALAVARGATPRSAAKPNAARAFSTTPSMSGSSSGTAAVTSRTPAPASASPVPTPARSGRSPQCRSSASSMINYGSGSRRVRRRCASRLAATGLKVSTARRKFGQGEGGAT